MAGKIVYQNQHVAIYIRGSDLDQLIGGFTISLPLYQEKSFVLPNAAKIKLVDEAKDLIDNWRETEKAVIQAARQEFLKANPDYRTSKQRKGK